MQILIMQATLIFEAVYVSLLLMTFLPTILSRCNIFIFLLYAFLAFLPNIIALALGKAHLFVAISMIGCIGSFRRAEYVSTVIREDKTTRLVRKLMGAYKMYLAADLCGKTMDRVDYDWLLDGSAKEEILDTFDMFDTTGEGSVSVDDFRR